MALETDVKKLSVVFCNRVEAELIPFAIAYCALQTKLRAACLPEARLADELMRDVVKGWC